MSHLSDFPYPSISGPTLCERNSKLFGEPNIGLLDYRKISVKEAFSKKKSLACSESLCREAFKTADETLIDTFRNKWYSDGLAGIFDELSHVKQVPLHLQRVFVKFHDWVNALNKWRLTVLPKKHITEVPERKTLLSCHPHTGRVAIIIKDNTVKVLNLNRIGETDQEVLLRDKRISEITCLSWRPKSSISIAAGSTNGIMVWLVEPGTVSSIKPGSHMARYLSSNDMNSEVLSISWCSDGMLLACTCKNSSSFWIWNILSQSSTPIHRVGSTLSFVSWSPCKQRLLAACNSSTFRIWETLSWSYEKWEDLNGKCTNACWSSCGSYLLFSVSDEPVIYYTYFAETIDIGGSGTAMKCADVSTISFPDGDSETAIGGLISDMAWDPTDSRLAVTFHGCQPYVALYHTRKQPNLQLIPCGFVRGDESEIPLAIDFVNGYEKGSLLSVYWSSEEISLIPLLFNHSLSPRLHAPEISHFDTTVHSVVDDIGEVPSMHNNVSLYSTE